MLLAATKYFLNCRAIQTAKRKGIDHTKPQTKHSVSSVTIYDLIFLFQLTQPINGYD